MLGYHCVKRMCLCLYARVRMCTEKSILFAVGTSLKIMLLSLEGSCLNWEQPVTSGHLI